MMGGLPMTALKALREVLRFPPAPIDSIPSPTAFTLMDPERKEAYRHLVYAAFIHLRSEARGVVWWNPVSWWQAALELRKRRDLADCFHNLAAFSVWDFERFEEERFWQDIAHLENIHGRVLVERYRRIFDAYVAGQAVCVC